MQKIGTTGDGKSAVATPDRNSRNKKKLNHNSQKYISIQKRHKDKTINTAFTLRTDASRNKQHNSPADHLQASASAAS